VRAREKGGKEETGRVEASGKNSRRGGATLEDLRGG